MSFQRLSSAGYGLLCLLVIVSGAQAQLTGAVDIDISGLRTGGDDPLDNELLVIDLQTGGRDALIDGVGFDVTIEALSPSWLSHAAIDLNSAFFVLPAGAPGFGGDDFPGTSSYSSGGIDDITMIPIPGGGTFDASFPAPGGILNVMLFEFVDDPALAPDGFWGSSSTLSVTYSYVPEPDSLALLCIVGFVALRTTVRRVSRNLP